SCRARTARLGALRDADAVAHDVGGEHVGARAAHAPRLDARAERRALPERVRDVPVIAVADADTAGVDAPARLRDDGKTAILRGWRRPNVVFRRWRAGPTCGDDEP